MRYYIQRIAAVCLIAGGGLLLGIVHSNVEFDTTPEQVRQGWAGPAIVEEAQPLVAGLKPFQLVDDEGRPVVQANENANVRHWDAVLKHRGSHLPNYPQKTGDCVSFGGKNALEHAQYHAIETYALMAEAGLTPRGPPPAFRPIATYYLYGYSRVNIGKGRLGRSAGSVGAWLAKGVQEGGVLALDEPGCPPYSGQLADEIGFKGPPQEWIDKAKGQLVRAVAPVQSAEQVRDAVVNGHTVTIASNFGTKTIRPQDGRMVARWDDTWYHQMCVLAYDGSAASGKKYFYVLNSWGATAHPAPMQNEPPGGFWVEWSDMDKIAKQGDSWAFSLFDGFKAFDLNFRIVGAAGPDAPQVQEGAVMQTLLPLVNSIDGTTGSWLALAIIVAGLALLALGNVLRDAQRRRTPQLRLFVGVMVAGILSTSAIAASASDPVVVDFRATPAASTTLPDMVPRMDFRTAMFQPPQPQPKTPAKQPPKSTPATPATTTTATTSDEPPVLHIYGDPKTCVHCSAEYAEVKQAAADGRLPFRVVIHSDPDFYPRLVVQREQSGYPMHLWKRGNSYMFAYGRMTIDQLLAQVKTDLTFSCY